MIDGFVDWRIRFIDLLINWLIGSSLHGSWTIWNWFQNWLIYIFINIYRFPPYVIDWYFQISIVYGIYYNVCIDGFDWLIDILIYWLIYIFIYSGFQRMWGQDSVDLLQNRHILPADEIKPPKPKLQE